MRVGNGTTNPFGIKDYKNENIEIKRASQESNYIYSLTKKAQGGDCNAIKKLLEYSLNNFNPEVEFAAKLLQEASDMLSNAQDIYTDGCGGLSDETLDCVKETVTEDESSDKTDVERAQEYNDLIAKMEISCSYL